MLRRGVKRNFVVRKCVGGISKQQNETKSNARDKCADIMARCRAYLRLGATTEYLKKSNRGIAGSWRCLYIIVSSSLILDVKLKAAKTISISLMIIARSVLIKVHFLHTSFVDIYAQNASSRLMRPIKYSRCSSFIPHIALRLI